MNRIEIKIDDELKRELKNICFNKGVSMSQVLKEHAQSLSTANIKDLDNLEQKIKRQEVKESLIENLNLEESSQFLFRQYKYLKTQLRNLNELLKDKEELDVEIDIQERMKYHGKRDRLYQGCLKRFKLRSDDLSVEEFTKQFNELKSIMKNPDDEEQEDLLMEWGNIDYMGELNE